MEIRESDKAAAAFRTVQAAAWAMVLAVPVYLTAVEIISRTTPDAVGALAGRDSLAWLRAVFALLSVAAFIAAGRLRRRLLVDVPPAEAVEGVLVPAVRLRRMQAAAMAAMALAELPAVFGLVLFLLGGVRFDFYLFAAYAAFALFVYFPSRTRWQEWYAARGRFR